MAKRGLVARIPIWVRVPGLIALVLVVVFISPMLLDAAGVGVNRGSDDMEEMEMDGDHSSGDGMESEGSDRGSGGEMESEGSDHGSGDEMESEGSDHGSGGDAERETSDHGGD